MNVYAADGRVMGIHDLQLPIYQMVGWHEGVMVFADDGRTMEISPFLIGAYEQVGWYTADAYAYRAVQREYHSYKGAANYSALLGLVEESLPQFYGTKYEASLYAIRAEAMWLWRQACGAPLATGGWYIGENSIGIPEAEICFCNISDKEIVAFKLTFTCYNIFGQVENTYYNYYYCDDAYMAPAEYDWFTWTLHGADSVHTLTNMRITEVVFADGTKWYR